MWTIGTSVAARALGLAGTLALTHAISPQDYGTVSVASVLVTTLGAIASLGLGQYVVAHPNAEARTTTHATWLHLVLGIVPLVAVWLGRAYAARVLGTPGLDRYLPPLVVAALLERLAYIPGRVLARNMAFRALALRLFTGEVAYVAVALAAAWHGEGAWSLVDGTLARAAVTTLVVIRAVPRKEWLDLRRPSLATTRELLRFGVPMSLANTLHWLSRRGDNLLIARWFGAGSAAHYNLAYNLADIPATHVGEPIGDVLLPTFARMPDPRARHIALLRALSITSLILFPLAIGLGVVGPTLVRASFGPAWAHVGPLLGILAALSAVRPIGWLLGSYLQAIHHAGAVMRLELAKVAALGVALPLGARLGIDAASGAVALGFALHALGSMYVVAKTENLPLRSLLRTLVGPTLSSTSLAASVLALRLARWSNETNPFRSLALEAVAGATSAIVTALFVDRRTAREVITLALERRTARGRTVGST